MKTINTLLCTAGILACATASQAAILNPDSSFASGDRAASANFNQVGTSLVVTLTNTFAGDTLDSSHLLTALFFDIAAPLSAVGGSATITAGTIFGAACSPGPCTGATTNVGGEWEYLGGLAGTPNGATKGISSTGLGLFGDANLNGPNLDDPTALNGANFGLSSAGDNTATGNGGLLGVPFVKNSTVFSLGGLTAGQNYTISNVFFLYGTALTECGGACGGGGEADWASERRYL